MNWFYLLVEILLGMLISTLQRLKVFMEVIIKVLWGYGVCSQEACNCSQFLLNEY